MQMANVRTSHGKPFRAAGSPPAAFGHDVNLSETATFEQFQRCALS